MEQRAQIQVYPLAKETTCIIMLISLVYNWMAVSASDIVILTEEVLQ